MRQVARVRTASWMSSRRSQRIRNRFIPWYQAMLRSTTQRTTPRPEPCAWPRRAMYGRIPFAWTASRYFLVVVGAVGPTSPMLRRPVVARQRGPGTVQPRQGAHHALPLPGHSHPDPVASHGMSITRIPPGSCGAPGALKRGTPGAGSGPKKRLDRKTRPRFGPTSPAAFCRRRRCQDVSVGTVDSVAVADRATAYHPALTGMSHQARSRLTANLTDAWTDQRDARRHHRRGAAQPA